MASEAGGDVLLQSSWWRRSLYKPLLRRVGLAGVLLLLATIALLWDVQLPPRFSWSVKVPERCSAEEQTVQEASVEVGEGPRVALLFFGLPRSLPFTLPSIHENVLQPLKDAGYRPTIFLHTYSDAGTDISSQGAAVNEWEALQPFRHVVTVQQDVLDEYSWKIEACLDNGTGWEKDGPFEMQATNTRNWICQLHSVSEVSQLWEKHFADHIGEYSAVAFMRPDVHYHDPFPVQVIPDLKEGEVYVPAWSDNGGINDRFALLHPANAYIWKQRLQFTMQHCLESPIHSETFTKDFADFEGLQARPCFCVL